MSDSATPWTVASQVPLPGGILQARILERFAISFSRSTIFLKEWVTFYLPGTLPWGVILLKIISVGTFLAAQWIRICLPMQGIWV